MGNRSGSITDKLKSRKSDKQLSSKSPLTTTSTSTFYQISNDNTHLETFLLVWLDPHVNTSEENLRTQGLLRAILTCLVTFNEIESCEKWLKKCCTDEKIILIVSGAYGEELVPKIHHLQTIITIYIYCLDVERNEIWSKKFSKIRSVVSSTNDLLKQLSYNQNNLESVEDSKALKIYKHQQEIYSLDKKTASFIWYQLLLEILISSSYIPSRGTSQELIQILRQYSSDDEYGSKLISDFEETYEPKRAVAWLTRDTPLARFVNKALREKDMSMIFALRFLLVDIHSQLIENQAQSLNVFKLQPMSKSDMENLKANPGQLIVINGFLFASTNMPKLISKVTNNDQFETVLFDISANFRTGVAPFASLRNIDSNIEEQIDREILFMCGSMFEVGRLIYEDSIWKLRLTLISASDSSVLSSMKHKLKENQNLCIIGDLLNQCNQPDEANIYYKKLLEELPKRHTLVSQINKQLTQNSKLNLASLPDVQCLLINLSEHMTPFTSAILNTLSSLTSKIIFIINNEPTIDLSQWSKKSTFIFTTAQFASSLESLPEHIIVFTLETDNDTAHQQRRFASIDDLICRLADEIIEKYRLEVSKYTKVGDCIKAKEHDKQANRIYLELRKVHEKVTKNEISSPKTSDNVGPILIWLLSNSKNDEEDTNFIKKTFQDLFSSYLPFYNEFDLHLYLAEQENINDIFLIIHSSYRESISTGSRQFKSIKYVYRYEEIKNEDEKIVTNRDDLGYHLTYDLITYYGKLGGEYRINKQSKKARDMFSKAQKLCLLLSENCFSTTK